jgi:hypothetical protein
MTHGLEGRCSIQLSYGRQSCAPSDAAVGARSPGVLSEAVRRESGRSDLNRGPPAPKAGALTGLRYAPLVPSGAEKANHSTHLGQPEMCAFLRMAQRNFIRRMRARATRGRDGFAHPSAQGKARRT